MKWHPGQTWGHLPQARLMLIPINHGEFPTVNFLWKSDESDEILKHSLLSTLSMSLQKK
jgi:hypothetical protein